MPTLRRKSLNRQPADGSSIMPAIAKSLAQQPETVTPQRVAHSDDSAATPPGATLSLKDIWADGPLRGVTRSSSYKAPKVTSPLRTRDNKAAKQAREKAVTTQILAAHVKLVETLRWMQDSKELDQRMIAKKWLPLVSECPGMVRQHHVDGCERLVFQPLRCRFALCPWDMRRKANRKRRDLAALLESPEFKWEHAATFLTLTVKSVQTLTRGANSAVGKAMTALRRRKVFADVAGGFQAREITYSAGGWHMAPHMLIDAPWMARFPQTDLMLSSAKYTTDRITLKRVRKPLYNKKERRFMPAMIGNCVQPNCAGGRSKHTDLMLSDSGEPVYDEKERRFMPAGYGDCKQPNCKGIHANHHAGIAREWTDCVQKQPAIKITGLYRAEWVRKDGVTVSRHYHVEPDRPNAVITWEPFNLDNPGHWLFVDMRSAGGADGGPIDFGAILEVAKYITKGSSFMHRGDLVAQFLASIKGQQMTKQFGSFQNRIKVKSGAIEFAEDLYGGEPDGADEPAADDPADDLPEHDEGDRLGECPYEDCPAPRAGTWGFVKRGPPELPDGSRPKLVYNPQTRSCAIYEKAET